MELSLNDLRELVGSSQSVDPHSDPLDPQRGDKVIIRTVTMYLVGRVSLVSQSWIRLDEASWVADTGRWSTALATGALVGVEPMGDGVLVSRGAIVDVTPWRHDLPTAVK